MEEKVLEVLENINESIVTYNGKNMFDDGIIDSFDVMNIVCDLEETFDIEIGAELVLIENFATTKAIISMVKSILAR